MLIQLLRLQNKQICLAAARLNVSSCFRFCLVPALLRTASRSLSLVSSQPRGSELVMESTEYQDPLKIFSIWGWRMSWILVSKQQPGSKLLPLLLLQLILGPLRVAKQQFDLISLQLQRSWLVIEPNAILGLTEMSSIGERQDEWTRWTRVGIWAIQSPRKVSEACAWDHF